jgi:ribose transport system ATP-binding protein
MRLVVRGVLKSFGATIALSRVDLEADAGIVHAVVGENGAGKSTLMKILAGESSPDAGDVLLDGVPFRPRSPRDAHRAGVAFVSQELAVCPHMTVAENIVLGVEPSRWGIVDRAAAEAMVQAALERVAGERPPGWLRPDVPVSDLPVAGRQLVEIARALSMPAGICKVLILDEPTSAIGGEDVERLFSTVRSLAKAGVAVLYVSHFLEEVARIADCYTVLRDGATVASGSMQGTTTSDLVERMAGRRIEQMYSRSARKRGDPILVIEQLAGRDKPVCASLTLYRGEVLGIAGLVGAGRTELLRAVFGLDPVRAGRVRVGLLSGAASPGRRLAQGVGLLSEDRKGEGLAATLSVADNLALSKLPAQGALGWIWPARIAALGRRWIDDLAIKARDPMQPVGELSGGNQQKVALARLMHHDVDVLLLDEPTRGIDVGSKAQIYSTIDGLASRGKAILLVSSYFPELLGMCDRICVMHRGELGEARPVSEWTERSLLAQATGTAP